MSEPRTRPDPVVPHPTAYYELQKLDHPSQIAELFGQSPSEFSQIYGANSDAPMRVLEHGKYVDKLAIFMQDKEGRWLMAGWYWGGSQLIRIPKGWMEPRAPEAALPFLRNADGSRWRPEDEHG